MLDVEVDNFTWTELRTRSLAHPPLLFTRVDVTSFSDLDAQGSENQQATS